ncbi:MAG: hypothetical protein H7Z41_05010, partial [Cytophagales bacterium]|nr:hypothetical protein [Armatimonadota bacterium]
PHPPNFTPVAAMALFGAAMLPDKRLALLAPLAALLLSDLFLGFYGWEGMASVYGATLLVGLLGYLALGRGRGGGPLRIVAASFGGSVVFFLVTNAACWWTGYPHTAEGLSLCFTLALPFFRNEALGTLLGTGVLFGGHALILRAQAAPRKRAAATPV